MEVVDTAAYVFATRGYDATSIDDLTSETGLQRGGLYHYITGKKDLLFAVHDRCMRPLLEGAQAVELSGAPPAQALRALARVLMRSVDEYYYHVRVVLQEWRTMAMDPRWPEVHRERRTLEQIIIRTIERGVAEGVFEVSQPGLAALAFLGMINYSYQWLDPKGKQKPSDIADYYAELFVRGICK